jgi:hypothetical protein
MPGIGYSYRTPSPHTIHFPFLAPARAKEKKLLNPTDIHTPVVSSRRPHVSRFPIFFFQLINSTLHLCHYHAHRHRIIHTCFQTHFHQQPPSRIGIFLFFFILCLCIDILLRQDLYKRAAAATATCNIPTDQHPRLLLTRRAHLPPTDIYISSFPIFNPPIGGLIIFGLSCIQICAFGFLGLPTYYFLFFIIDWRTYDPFFFL